MPPGVELASFGQRLGAALIDSLLMTGVILLVVGALFAAGLAIVTALGGPDEAAAVLVVLLVLGFVVYFALVLVGPLAYLAVTTASPHGATIGKALVGIEVVDVRNGGRLPRARSWGRAAMYFFASTQVFYLGCLWMLWDEQQRTWHDMVVDSHVIVRRGPQPSIRDLFARHPA